MYNFWILVSYEYKKLLKRKILWLTVGIMVVLCIFSGLSPLLGDYYSEEEGNSSGYSRLKEDIADSKKISGRAIDDRFLKELQNKGVRVPNQMWELMMNVMADWNGKSMVSINETEEDTEERKKTFTEKEFYEEREKIVEDNWKESWLTEGEKTYLTRFNSKITTPWTYEYSMGYEMLVSMLYTIGVMEALLIAICIPFVFAEEHTQKMSPLIQSSSLGKKTLFLAKIFVGVTFSAAATLLLYLVSAICVLSIYGGDGFGAQIQLMVVKAPWLLSIGQVVLILMGVNLVVVIFYAVFTMLLSEKYKSNIVPMAILTGVTILTLFLNIPEKYRVLSQILDCFPLNMATIWGTFSVKLFPFFGTWLTAWQAVPVIYFLLCLLGVGLCYQLYRNYQVK